MADGAPDGTQESLTTDTTVAFFASSLDQVHLHAITRIPDPPLQRRTSTPHPPKPGPFRGLVAIQYRLLALELPESKTLIAVTFAQAS